jgi:kynureninase
MASLNDRAKRVGTRIVWDLSHSAGAIPLELNKHGTQLAAGCGYKYLNGGPGAPSFLYLAKELHANFATPLSGWFGHQSPFAFETSYAPAPGIARMQCGTPPVIAMAALECGIDTFLDAPMDAIRTKSSALSEVFRTLVKEQCATCDLTCISPVAPEARGSQLSFAHDHAYPIMQALIDRHVVGDFRQPNLMRFGFAPLYVRFVDCWDAVATLREVMLSGAWRADKYFQQKSVT